MRSHICSLTRSLTRSLARSLVLSRNIANERTHKCVQNILYHQQHHHCPHHRHQCYSIEFNNYFLLHSRVCFALSALFYYVAHTCTHSHVHLCACVCVFARSPPRILLHHMKCSTCLTRSCSFALHKNIFHLHTEHMCVCVCVRAPSVQSCTT